MVCCFFQRINATDISWKQYWQSSIRFIKRVKDRIDFKIYDIQIGKWNKFNKPVRGSNVQVFTTHINTVQLNCKRRMKKMYIYWQLNCLIRDVDNGISYIGNHPFGWLVIIIIFVSGKHLYFVPRYPRFIFYLISQYL